MSNPIPGLAGESIALKFDSVSFSYGAVPVLENASFAINRGEFAALVGPNGSGKTTVLKLLLGLEQSQSGMVEIPGVRSGVKPDLGAVPASGAKPAGIGYVPQQTPFDPAFPIPVRDVVRMGRLHPGSRAFTAEDRRAVEEALEQAEIAAFADRPYVKLSGGQRRRVLVARALASRPGLLVLDEPTANMDRESEERLLGTLRKLKGSATILIVTHDIEFVADLTDRVLVMGSRERPHGIIDRAGAVGPPPIAETVSETGKGEP
ncbi:putative metal transport system ATP-binding protein [Spirochaetia bacterium]|nr:putative metal transport system ATP-binding protein [Spirochaetia bacterium]